LYFHFAYTVLGRLAHAIADLMKELWIAPVDHNASSSWSANHNSINNNDTARRTSCYTIPSQVKRAVAIYAPRFAGSAQHDSQEFLAYLLDGLHEDLNRIQGRAPYVSTPDYCDDNYDDDDDRRHLIDGVESWDAYQQRNSSLIVDSFYGQFKSTCVCPLCERVSVSFGEFRITYQPIFVKSFCNMFSPFGDV
jgi:ubiquitin C-terminal hydrolase